MGIKYKTTYDVMAAYADTDQVTIYAEHFDELILICGENGAIIPLSFYEWSPGNDLWDALCRLYDPRKKDGSLKEKVVWIKEFPWKE